MKKIVTVLLTVLMVLTLAACSSKQEAKEEAKETKTLIMGTEATFQPYEYYDGDEIVGIDVEIAQAICDKLGYELEVKDADFDTLIVGVQTGKFDFSAAGMTVTEERLEKINFSDTYATGIQVIIVKEDSPITSVDDLYAEGANYLVGTQDGTTGNIYALDDFGEENVKGYKKTTDAATALVNGQIDCIILDNEPAKAIVNNNTGLKILETEYSVEDYAIAIAKENTALLEEFNTALKALIEDGTVKTIVDKYIAG